MWKYVKWAIISISLVLVLGLAGLIGLFAYLVSDTCDDAIPTPFTNARGDIAEEQLQVCTFIGTVLNHSIALQPQGARAAKTLVQYSPVIDGTKLRWINDHTLMIDLGKVYAIWAAIHKAGRVKIVYAYSKGE